MPPHASTTDFRNKLLIVNAGIFVGLAFQFWRGTPLAPILLTGLVLVLLVNVVLYLSSRPKQNS